MVLDVAPVHLFIHRVLDIPAAHAFAIVRTGDLRLVTFAIILQTARPFTIAPFGVLPDGTVSGHVLGLADFRPERVRIALQTRFDRPLAVVFVLQIVEAIHAVAHVAELAVGETIAIQLQTLRLGAIARLPGTHPVRLHVGVGGSGRGFGGWGGALVQNGGVTHGDGHFLGDGVRLEVVGQYDHLIGGGAGILGGDRFQRLRHHRSCLHFGQ